jgi:D-alanyl-D-alanine carboxypeptidase/D-alanyl-D-alanine-endopeptidase (penicillin-binding protein 4)
VSKKAQECFFSTSDAVFSHWYGTGHSALNWRENEFTIDVQPGSSINSPARVVQIKKPPPRLRIINKLTTSSSSSDASLYFALDGSNVGYLHGTISLDAPANYSLRCAVPNSALYAADELTQALRAHGIEVEQEAVAGASEQSKSVVLDVYRSPPLSKLLVPFLRISINMYGEVLVKTIAHHLGQSSLSDAPRTILPSYVTTLLGDENVSAGVATTDGSGLSRSNRLSTHALARTLFAVQDQSWFVDVFYEAFPTINGLKMKSGTLMNTIAYAGYVREHSLVFSFMINNYHGEQDTEMRKKIWTLLDTLK